MRLNVRKGKQNAFIIAAVVLSLAVTGVLLLSYNYAETVNAGLSQNMVRLHVIANSDSKADQSLKLKVRDAIISYMKDKLADSQNIEQTRGIIRENLKSIEEISSGVIKENNSDYTVKATLGNYPFPTKLYGDIALPAGDYEALRVVIGKGEGANWWCVLFPPLCFVDATHGAIPETVKQSLKASLTDEEFSLITSGAYEQEDIPVKIRFKLVELMEGSRIKLAAMLHR